MCIPKSNHKTLINECYPPAKLLGGIGPEYKANSNELSRLTHYANRKPAKLTKVGSVLQQKAASEAKGVTGTGLNSEKAKGALMVTLAITKDLIVECQRELNYFTNSAAAVIQSALQAAGRGGANGTRDLEISCRAASTFYAFSVYIDSSTASTDADTRKAYTHLLSQFSKLASEKLSDADAETKARLVGMGSIAGAISSDAFYNSNYTEQLTSVLPSLLKNIDATAYLNYRQILQEEATKLAESGIASNKEYSAKRKTAATRSIPDFNLNGEKGVSYSDLASAAIGNLHSILHYGDATHIRAFVGVFIDYLNGKQSSPRQWEHRDWCCWIVEAICSWTALQYRFVVLTHLVEYLVEDCEGPVQDKHFTLIAMITTLFSSKLSMIGLSTSDTANNLLGFVVRRVYVSSSDELLPSLIGCISSLATHIYYADQLNDMAEEITARIAALELPEAQDGEAGSMSTYMDRQAARDSIRVLLACLVGLMKTSHKSSEEGRKETKEAGAQTGEVHHSQAGTRNQISTSAWHQTASLLASPDYLVRQAYDEALFIFFSSEVGSTSVSGINPLSDSLESKLSVEATGFIHSLSAALYVLTISKVLYAPTSVKDSPLEALPVVARSNKDEGRRLEAGSVTESALPIDFAAAIKLLEVMFEQIPIASLLGLVPALLAINAASSSLPSVRKEAVQILLSTAFSRIGTIWGVAQLQFRVQTSSLPTFPAPSGQSPAIFSESTSAYMDKNTAINASAVVSSLSSSDKIQSVTGLDSKVLQNWFTRDWNVQIAVDDSFVGASPFVSSDEEGINKSNRLVPFSERSKMETSSLNGTTASYDARSGVGVDDFRQALGTRSYGSRASNINGDMDGANSTDTDKRASRRASRKISQPIKLNGTGNNGSVGGLLDSMKVGVAEENGGVKLASAPRVAA
ncbi:hypothetical protein CBS101457_001286 [Exobasidium rhododendri]|nr:hypothetical protein CBS101457_001286 [Exobasidium rhododendri]